MATLTISKSVTGGGGDPLNSTMTQTASGEKNHDDTLVNAGKSGTLTTRTDDNTGVITLGSSHGVTDSHIVDVYWAGGVRYGMTVTGTDSTTISIDGGAGDVLPAAETTVVVGITEDIVCVLTGDDARAISIVCNKRCHVDFQDAGGSELPLEIAANGGWDWTYDSGLANPIAGDSIIIARVSCGETVAGRFRYRILYDDTP